MNNYAWTLIISWKRKFYWIKNILSVVIQNQKYLVVFHKHKINCLQVFYLISCVIFGLFIFFISLCKIEYFGTLTNISLNMFWNFLFIILSFKRFKNLVICFIFSLKEWETCAWLCFFWFSQRVFSLQHFWAWTFKLFLRVTKPKHCYKVFWHNNY